MDLRVKLLANQSNLSKRVVELQGNFEEPTQQYFAHSYKGETV